MSKKKQYSVMWKPFAIFLYIAQAHLAVNSVRRPFMKRLETIDSVLLVNNLSYIRIMDSRLFRNVLITLLRLMGSNYWFLKINADVFPLGYMLSFLLLFGLNLDFFFTKDSLGLFTVFSDMFYIFFRLLEISILTGWVLWKFWMMTTSWEQRTPSTCLSAKRTGKESINVCFMHLLHAVSVLLCLLGNIFPLKSSPCH